MKNTVYVIIIHMFLSYISADVQICSANAISTDKWLHILSFK